MAEEPAAPPSRLRGFADRIDRYGAAGWAFDPDRPDAAVELEIIDNDEVIAWVTADRLREGLADAGIGDGRHSFQVRFDPPLSPDRPHCIRIRGAIGGPELRQSGVVIEPGDGLIPDDPLLVDTIDPDDLIRFHIDDPVAAGKRAELAGNANLFVEGWAIATLGIARIDILLDGVLLGGATYGLPRQGVYETFPDRPNALLSGFAFSAPQRPTEGAHTVTIIFHDTEGFARNAEFELRVLPRSHEPAAWMPRRGIPHTERSRKLAALAATGWRPRFIVALYLQDADPPTLAAARRSVQSLRRQAYPDWCFAVVATDGGETGQDALLAGCDDLAERLASFPIPADTAGAPAYIVPLPAGDELGADALLAFALAGSGHPEREFLYGDERRVDPASGAIGPYFKPDWSPDLLLSNNYIGRAWAASAALFTRAGLEPAACATREYDAVLRLSEAAIEVGHIPQVLSVRGPAPAEAAEKERDALAAAMARRGIEGDLLAGCVPGIYRLKRKLANPGKVSIVMPTAGARGFFRTAIETLRRVTRYPAVEIVAVDNIPAVDDEARQWLAAHTDVLVRLDEPFNWSRFVNAGAAAARGDYLLFLNDDVEIIEPDWLEAMVEHAQRPEVAIVGAQLLFPDRTVQHAGLFLTRRGARHVFRFLRHDAPGAFGLALTQREVIAVTGACFLVRRDRFEALGGFDEALGIIDNDLDFCLRAHRAGFKTVFTPYSSLVHHEKATRVALEEGADETRFRNSWAGLLAAGDPFFNPNLTRSHDDWLPDPEPVEILCPSLPLAPQAAVRRIVALKLDQIGDFINALPAFRRLKTHFPHAEVVVVGPPEVETLCGLEGAIDRVIVWPQAGQFGDPETLAKEAAGLAERLYPLAIDVAVDLRRQPETRPLLQCTGARWLAGFDRGDRFPWLDIAIAWDGDLARTRKQRHVLQDFLLLIDGVAAAFEPRPSRRWLKQSEARDLVSSLPPLSGAFADWIEERVAAIHPSANAENRRWPPEYFAALIDLLVRDGMRCVIVGSAEDRDLAELLVGLVESPQAVRSLTGSVPLSDLPLLLQACDLMVGNNSGPQHLAAMLGVPTVNVHSGVMEPREWEPLGPNAVTVRRAVTCSPCYLAEASQCHRGLACLTTLDPLDVLRACRAVLGAAK